MMPAEKTRNPNDEAKLFGHTFAQLAAKAKELKLAAFTFPEWLASEAHAYVAKYGGEIRNENGRLTLYLKKLRKNPIHPITAFAAGASGILSALQIRELMKGKKAARRKNPAKFKFYLIRENERTNDLEVVAKGNNYEVLKRKANKKNDFDDYDGYYYHVAGYNEYIAMFRYAGQPLPEGENPKMTYNMQRPPQLKRNIPGYIDELGRFRPIESGEGYSPVAAGKMKSAPRRRADAGRNLVKSAKRATSKAQHNRIITALAKHEGVARDKAARMVGKYKPIVNPKTPSREVFLLTIYDGRDVRSAILHDGERGGWRKSFTSYAAAKSWLKNHRSVKLSKDTPMKVNPADAEKIIANGAFGRFLARRKAMRAYGKELRLEAALKRTRKRRQKAEQAYNPAKIPHRRTFSMFQGRPSTEASEKAVSEFAPSRMDQLGELIELKLASGKIIRPNPSRFKLCSAGGRLWIAGGKFARRDAKQKANVLNPIDRIDHVVYQTHKPHLGDLPDTHYIHSLGEESGKWPLLAVDREGYPVIRGGNYKIEARGIVD